MKKIFFILPVLLLFLSYGNLKVLGNQLMATVTDVSRLDGCGLLIKLNGETTMEPFVLPQGFTLQKDKRVNLINTILKDKMSICMNGSIAEITSISYL